MLENEAVEPLTRSCSIDEEGPAVPVQNIQEGISKKFILLITCLCALCDCLLLSVIVPIIPVYLNEDKPNARLQDSDAINSTRNSSFASGPSSAISDSSMDFKIGALFASKAFVQVFTIC